MRDSTGSNRSRGRTATRPLRSAAPCRLAIALLASAAAAPAHDSLYNYVELRLGSDGIAILEFTVHGPALATRFGVDPTATGSGWLDELSKAQGTQLLRDAERFVRANYRIEIDGADPLAGRELEFRPPGTRTKANDSSDPTDSPTAARPGCYLGSIHLDGHPEALDLTYRNGDKRLMLVVTRPGTFPEIHDLAPGTSTRLSPATANPDETP